MIPENAREWLVSLLVALLLLPLPTLIAIFTLVQSGYGREAISALTGDYYGIYGVPSNPWCDFMPTVIASEVVFLVFHFLAVVIARTSGQNALKLLLIAPLNGVASAAFVVSTGVAALAGVYFHGGPYIGKPEPAELWLPFGLWFVVLMGGCYRAMLLNRG